MLNVELLWVFFLLPLPFLIYWLLPKAKQQQAAVRVPFYTDLNNMQQNSNLSVKRGKLRLFLLATIWCCLVMAASGPTWIGDAITLPSSGRDLLLAVDLSGSMAREDMKVNNETASRIIAVKAVLNNFIERRKGDRLGLVVFGTQAYIQAPLTFDRATVKQFLTEAQIGFAGEEQTAIGDAIGLSVKRLRDRPGDRHVMILLTDGQNNGGAVQPLQAAKLAAENNIIIYTIGIGADEMIVPGLFGSRRVNPSADLDEASLKEIAQLTRGQYFRARNPEELVDIYHLLDKLEPVDENEETFRPQKALFYWPLAIGLILSCALALSQFPWQHWLSLLKTRRQEGSI